MTLNSQINPLPQFSHLLKEMSLPGFWELYYLMSITHFDCKHYNIFYLNTAMCTYRLVYHDSYPTSSDFSVKTHTIWWDGSMLNNLFTFPRMQTCNCNTTAICTTHWILFFLPSGHICHNLSSATWHWGLVFQIYLCNLTIKHARTTPPYKLIQGTKIPEIFQS